MNIPRPEHPKPQFMRDSWLNLNGPWDFEIDNGRSGVARRMMEPGAPYSMEITVPFCPESALSGVEHKDFLYGVWYRRTVALTEAQLQGRVHLHFGAVDHTCTVFVNGQEAGRHTGGYVSFWVDITDQAVAGENLIAVYAEDDTRDPLIPRGKQSEEFFSHGCDYTRTTGIWQTVWLEFLPAVHIDRFRLYPDIATGSLTVVAQVQGAEALTVRAAYEGRPMGEACAESAGGSVTVTLPLAEKHLWEVGNGRLYDLTLTYGTDTVHSYFGLRSVSLDGKCCHINGKPVFQRLVLDQGFYPQGVYTAPTDGELLADIQRSMAMGFNGARLHEKIFEERFLYHADRMGYLVWGEFPNWGLDHTRPEAVYGILPQWLEEMERDFNHPAIVGWCPFNETWDQDGRRQCDDVLRAVYRATKTADPTRPCIDTSGSYHVETDIFDVHDYEQDPAKFAATYPYDGPFFDRFAKRQPYGGQPLMVSEYGGIGYSLSGAAWSYGNAAQSREEYIARFKALADVMLNHPAMLGFCYTQLTDVEQEQNGVYTYDRQPKVDPAVFHAILSRKAKIEE